MARTVIWAEAAITDLDEAAEYIARDSRFYAAALVRDARAASRSLAGFAWSPKPVIRTSARSASRAIASSVASLRARSSS